MLSSSTSPLLPSALLLLLLAPSTLAQVALPTTTAGLISTYGLTDTETLSQPSSKESANKTDDVSLNNASFLLPSFA
jgi:hypothetical protein